MRHDRRVDGPEEEADEHDGGRVDGERGDEPYAELEAEGEEEVRGEGAPFAELSSSFRRSGRGLC